MFRESARRSGTLSRPDRVRVLCGSVVAMSLAVIVATGVDAGGLGQSVRGDEFEELRLAIESRTASAVQLGRFAVLAREEGNRESVLMILDRNSSDQPGSVLAAGAYYTGLMEAEQFERAAEAAGRVERALELSPSCSPAETTTIACILRADAADRRVCRSFAESTSAEAEITATQCVALADQLGGDITIPPPLQDLGVLTGLHLSLQSRLIVALRMDCDGRQTDAREVWKEILRICPSYQDERTCNLIREELRNVFSITDP
jgi:hypothetical protein